MTISEPSNLALTISRWLFLVYLVLLPVVRPLDFRYLGIHILFTDLVFAGAFVFWVSSLRGRTPRIDRTFLAYAGTFFLTLVLSAIFSTEHFKSAIKLIGVGYLIAIALMTADLVQHPDYLKPLVIAWLIASLVTLLGILTGALGFLAGYTSPSNNFFLFHSGSLPAGDYPRVASFFENPNMTANYLNVAIMFALAAGRTGWLSIKSSLVFAVAIFASALFTLSAGLGGMVLSISLWVAFVLGAMNGTIRRTILCGGILIAFLAVASSTISPVTRNTGSTIAIPFTDIRVEPAVRAIVWKNTIERGLEYPILGRGTGTDAANVRYTVLSGQRQWLRDAHQAWLNVFGQAGIIGLGAFIALSFFLFSSLRFRNSSGSIEETVLAACSCAFVGAFLLQNLFGSFEDARHLWVLIGMLVGLNLGVKNRSG